MFLLKSLTIASKIIIFLFDENNNHKIFNDIKIEEIKNNNLQLVCKIELHQKDYIHLNKDNILLKEQIYKLNKENKTSFH